MAQSTLLVERSFCGQSFRPCRKINTAQDFRKTSKIITLAERKETTSGKVKQNSKRTDAEQTDEELKSFGKQFYVNLTGFPFPLGPIFRRPTVRTEVRALPFNSNDSYSHSMTTDSFYQTALTKRFTAGKLQQPSDILMGLMSKSCTNFKSNEQPVK